MSFCASYLIFFRISFQNSPGNGFFVIVSVFRKRLRLQHPQLRKMFPQQRFKQMRKRFKRIWIFESVAYVFDRNSGIDLC